ncbi:HINT domain-containing protein [Neisseria gonorrhoeae]|uniref:HINT domain-containing protein n=1 Tax=Neisseria gonorrhoeae TaxID=485 RepID=UPI0021D03680|nr:HINT domain-containing protein [Neisseria gonorrhoeae]MCU4680920.1 HINT domain-containing protein [Neisseria gonorrhoeae]
MVKTADGYKAIARIRGRRERPLQGRGKRVTDANLLPPIRQSVSETVYIEVSDGIGNSQTLISNRIHSFYSAANGLRRKI